MDRYGRVSAGSAGDVTEAETFLAAYSPCPDVEFDGRQTVDPSRVLIVDTDFSRCSDVAALVHSVGWFETKSAFSAEAALELAGNFLPGFVLISTDVPDLSSYWLASMLHQHRGLFESRLIALTCEIVAADRRVALLAGFEQYLTLPLEQVALEKVLLYRSHRGLVRRRNTSRA